jgi:hypothetical protein
MCGLDGSMFGMGCVDYATVKATLMGVIQVPDPVRCDAAGDDGGAPTGNDAGN